MAARSQDPSFETSGRVNQKRRTRAAVVAAARTIVERGDNPTVAQAAAEALVSRTTAYRYFPTQESLLLELSVTVSIDTVDAMLAQPVGKATPEERLVELVEVFTRSVAANEALYRAAQRHYLDTWLAAERSDTGHEQPVREGRRREWIAAVLEPMRETMSAGEWQRLQAALCLVLGGEAFTVLRDVCHLDPDEAIAIAKWAAAAILTVGSGDSVQSS